MTNAATPTMKPAVDVTLEVGRECQTRKTGGINLRHNPGSTRTRWT